MHYSLISLTLEIQNKDINQTTSENVKDNNIIVVHCDGSISSDDENIFDDIDKNPTFDPYCTTVEPTDEDDPVIINILEDQN